MREYTYWHVGFKCEDCGDELFALTHVPPGSTSESIKNIFVCPRCEKELHDMLWDKWGMDLGGDA